MKKRETVEDALVVSLYRAGVKLKDILEESGYKSYVDIYKVLRRNNCNYRNKGVGERRTISIMPHALKVLEDKENISLYINKAIVFYEHNKSRMLK